jgi:hypothetical protein
MMRPQQEEGDANLMVIRLARNTRSATAQIKHRVAAQHLHASRTTKQRVVRDWKRERLFKCQSLHTHGLWREGRRLKGSSKQRQLTQQEIDRGCAKTVRAQRLQAHDLKNPKLAAARAYKQVFSGQRCRGQTF